jgi:hypothetical protein
MAFQEGAAKKNVRPDSLRKTTATSPVDWRTTDAEEAIPNTRTTE